MKAHEDYALVVTKFEPYWGASTLWWHHLRRWKEAGPERIFRVFFLASGVLYAKVRGAEEPLAFPSAETPPEGVGFFLCRTAAVRWGVVSEEAGFGQEGLPEGWACRGLGEIFEWVRRAHRSFYF